MTLLGDAAPLGPLAGARAEITASTPWMGQKTQYRATAFVILANGAVHERDQKGNAAVRRAQAEVVRFNALVVRAAGAGAGTEGS
jgi:hypothetical protein